MVLGAILVAIGSGIISLFNTVKDVVSETLSFVGRIIGWAPKPFKILIFLVIGFGLLGLIGNWFVGASHVCSEGVVYEADSLLWAMTAKAKHAGSENLDFGTDDSDRERFEATQLETPTGEPFGEQQEGVILQQPFSDFGVVEFGTFMGRNGDMFTPLQGATEDQIVVAVPLTQWEGQNLSDFSFLTTMFTVVGPVGIALNKLDKEKKLDMYVCQASDPSEYATGSVQPLRNARFHGNPGAGECYLTAPAISSIGCALDRQIAIVTYRLIPVDSSDAIAEIVDTNPSAIEVSLDSSDIKWILSVEYDNPTTSSILSFFDIAQNQSLNACTQSPMSRGIYVTPASQQVKSILGFERTVDIPEQAGYVKGKYIAIDRQGIDAIVASDEDERGSFIQQRAEHFMAASFSDDDVVTFTCDEGDRIVPEVVGVQVFSLTFMVVLFFFIAVMTFLKWILW